MSALRALIQPLRRAGDGVVEVCVSSGDGFRGKRGEGVESAGCAHSGAAIGAGEEGVDGGSQRVAQAAFHLIEHPIDTS
jgi:hypothetical protein